ncbi:hypothetical protein RHMOL_Rhmol06G0146700 [Rhododendron molle]|uniref:Uncharacterized protein n=1 Tax=Rhododendron molle TaxID=49168 RepID=A0ACC0ND64_RHOML|nr:hypothetical protein RHMOL_Rhmol06G0146700 [Rhododendron molle]
MDNKISPIFSAAYVKVLGVASSACRGRVGSSAFAFLRPKPGVASGSRSEMASDARGSEGLPTFLGKNSSQVPLALPSYSSTILPRPTPTTTTSPTITATRTSATVELTRRFKTILNTRIQRTSFGMVVILLVMWVVTVPVFQSASGCSWTSGSGAVGGYRPEEAEINTVADSSPPEGGFVKERLDPVVGKSGGFSDDFTPPNPPYLFSDHLFSFLKSRPTKREKREREREKRGGRRSTLVTPPVDRRLQLSLVFLLSRAELSSLISFGLFAVMGETQFGVVIMALFHLHSGQSFGCQLWQFFPCLLASPWLHSVLFLGKFCGWFLDSFGAAFCAVLWTVLDSHVMSIWAVFGLLFVAVLVLLLWCNVGKNDGTLWCYYWVVFVSRSPRIYTTWETAGLQVNGYPGNLFKRYTTFDEAEGALLQFHEERYRLLQM